MTIPSWLVMFFSAELIFLLMRKKDIEILLKKKSQREPEEQYQVERGLLRSVIFEGLLFVPASATLIMLLLVPLVMVWLESWLSTIPQGAMSVYAGMGVLSYQFPFAVVQQLITQRALRALNKFAGLAPPEYQQRVQEQGKQDQHQHEANRENSG